MTATASEPGHRRAFLRPRAKADGAPAQGASAPKLNFKITPQSWAFGFRSWLAMVLALLVAFWLQLDSASSAAVCVGILALPTRGQAMQKAFYRFSATAVGVVASIAIAGLFSQARDLFVLAVAAWLALSVFAAGLLEGNRAYGAVLSGYTVAIVAVGQIDTPQDVFMAGISRGAAEVIGIISLAVINDSLFAPDLFPGVMKKLEDTHASIHDFVMRALTAGEADPAEVAALLGRVTTLRPDITALPNESISGRARAAAARIAAIAMVRQISATRAVAETLFELGPDGKAALDELTATIATQSNAKIDALRDHWDAQPVHGAVPKRLVARSAGLVLLEQTCRARAALDDMRLGRGLTAAPGLPLFRSREVALRHALRAFLAVLVSAFFFVITGWPSSSIALVQLAALAGISATNPNPRAFAAGALVAMPMATVMGGVVQFLVLDGVDQFPLLALAMAPPIFVSALLIMSGNQKLFGIGFLSLVFFPVFLSPENPQSYNPLSYITLALLANTAVIGLFICLTVILPVNDDMRRRWLMRAGRDGLAQAMSGRNRSSPPVAAFRDADRIAQLGQLSFSDDRARFETLAEAIETADLASALRRLRYALDDPALDLQGDPMMTDAHAALVTWDSDRLRRAAERVTTFDNEGSDASRAAVRRAAAALVFAADLLERRPELVSPGPQPR